MAERLGILGGTFDPVHLGHLQAARETAEAFNLSRIVLVLSARPPHKPNALPATVAHRLAMLRLAATGDPLFEVSDIEARRSGPSYMIDTLTQLAQERPHAELALIMGYDAYLDVDTWYRSEDLLTHADLIVTSRPDSAETEPPGPLQPPIAARNACCYDPDIGCFVHSSGHSLRYFQLTRGLPVSASAIRACRERGDDIRPLVGADIANYIENGGLYLTI